MNLTWYEVVLTSRRAPWRPTCRVAWTENPQYFLYFVFTPPFLSQLVDIFLRTSWLFSRLTLFLLTYSTLYRLKRECSFLFQSIADSVVELHDLPSGQSDDGLGIS